MKSAELFTFGDGLGLVDALADAGRSSGWWQASGFVEEVELRVAGDGADPRRNLRGRHTLVSLSGPTGGPYTVLLARAGNGGFELSAGELVSARSAGVRALWLPARAQGQEPDFEEASEPARAAEPKPSAAASNWAAQAAAVANARYVPDDEEEQQQPERGDLVHHFAFGWCEVIQVAGERLKLRDVSGPGRIREIVIDVLDVKGPTEKDGKKAFKLTRKS